MLEPRSREVSPPEGAKVQMSHENVPPSGCSPGTLTPGPTGDGFAVASGPSFTVTQNGFWGKCMRSKEHSPGIAPDDPVWALSPRTESSVPTSFRLLPPTPRARRVMWRWGHALLPGDCRAGRLAS